MLAPTSTGPVDSYLVMMLGAPGVGKAALTSQFRTSECINAYEGPGKSRPQSMRERRIAEGFCEKNNRGPEKRK